MYKRVVVPLDGSPLAEAILPFILEIAGPLDMGVTLVRVVPPVPPEVIEGSRHVVLEDVEGRLAEARQYLAPLVERLVAKGIRADGRARHGTPVAEIIGATRDVGADLVAMTTHGRSGLGRLLFGSVAEAVLRQSEVPVFLLRLTEDEATRVTGAAVQP